MALFILWSISVMRFMRHELRLFTVSSNTSLIKTSSSLISGSSVANIFSSYFVLAQFYILNFGTATSNFKITMSILCMKIYDDLDRTYQLQNVHSMCMSNVYNCYSNRFIHPNK